jgi:hypothetical protein
MRAYLKLVQASMLWYANRKLSALAIFVHSLVANPRLTIQNSKLHRALPIADDVVTRDNIDRN